MASKSSDPATAEAQSQPGKRASNIPNEVLLDILLYLSRCQLSACRLVSSKFDDLLTSRREELPLYRLSYVSIYPGTSAGLVEVKISSSCGRKLEAELPEEHAIQLLSETVRWSFVRAIELHRAVLTYRFCKRFAEVSPSVRVGNLTYHARNQEAEVDSATFKNFFLGFAAITNLLHLLGTLRRTDFDDEFIRRCVQKGVVRIRTGNDMRDVGFGRLTDDGILAFCFAEASTTSSRWLQFPSSSISDRRTDYDELLERLAEAHASSSSLHEVDVNTHLLPKEGLDIGETNACGMRLRVYISCGGCVVVKRQNTAKAE